MARSKGRKKRTQVQPPPEGESGPSGEKIPKSFVFSRGKLPVLLRQLQHDLRQVMLPYTALKLKGTGRNSMKDFVHVAGPLGVSHFLMLSHTKNAAYLKIARSPHGPTLSLKILNYSLARDIARAQIRPRSPLSIFRNSPLVVLNGFGTAEEHLKLIQIMFQNMFPVINVNTVKLAACQRVLLLNYDKSSKCIEFRHYSVSAHPVGVSRSVRKLVQRKRLPDLGSLGDVSEFITKPGYGSESEVEDETSKVELADEFGKGNHAAQRSSVKLHEVGPRMTMQLVKVEEGLCSGGVMFHEYVQKSPEEVAELRAQVEKREALRKQRKAEQEANVKRKEQEKSGRKRRSGASIEAVQETGTGDNADAKDDDVDDDVEYYRSEVGHEPDEAFKSGASKRKFSRPAGMSKRYFGGGKGSKDGSNGRRTRKSDGPGDVKERSQNKPSKKRNSNDDIAKDRKSKKRKA